MSAKYAVPSARTTANFEYRRRQLEAQGRLVRCDLTSCGRGFPRGRGASCPWVANRNFCSTTCLEFAIQRGQVASPYVRFGPRGRRA
jgi:hypothetical protein